MKKNENAREQIMMNFPPENFEQLRQLIALQRDGEGELKMGNKSLRSLVFMTDNPDIVALNNIVELSIKANISPASITRLSKLLGFKGFNHFQKIFKQKNTEKTNYYSQRVKYLVEDKTVQPKQVLEQQLKDSIKNMQQGLNDINQEKLIEAVLLLARKKRVFVYGHKQSSALANILKYGLCLIRQNVQTLGQTDQGIAIALEQLRKEDLLIVFSSSPYSNITVELASIAKKQSCKIMAITDSPTSPLHEHSEISFNIPTEGHYYTNSLAANCIFIEGLLSLTAMELGQDAVNKLQQHEDLLSQLNINS